MGWIRFAGPWLLVGLAPACGGSTSTTGAAPDSGAQYCGPDTVWCGGECVAVQVASQVCPGASSSSSGGGSGSGSGGITSSGGSGSGGSSGSSGGSGGSSGSSGGSGGSSGSSGGSSGSSGSSGGSGGSSGSSGGSGDAGAGIAALGYDVIDAAYSRSIDRIVIVTDTGNAVHLVDPHTLNDVSIALPTTPASVAVSPDGTHAAVGHNGFISYVDLTGQTISNTWNVPAPFGDVALSNTYVYGFPSSDQWVSLYAVQASTGAVTTSNNIYAGMQGAVSPDGTTLYGVDTDLDPDSLYSFSLATPGQPMTGSMYFGDMQSPCGALWISKDGTRLYTGCGYVFDSNGLAYFGELTAANQLVTGVDDWSADGTVAVLGGMSSSQPQEGTSTGALQLQIYEPEYLTLQTTLDFPPIATPTGDATSDGRFVFHDAAGTSTFAIVHGSAPGSQVDVFAVAKLQ